MPYGRKRKYTVKRKGGMRRYKRADDFAASKIQAVVRRTLAKNMETKTSVVSATDGTEIAHNNFITLDAAVLKTTQGVMDPGNTNLSNRIGDQIKLKGVAFKMMVELNERYSDITMRLIIVKSAKGDVPSRATLFQGQSGNKMLDTFNQERYSVLYSKTFKMKSPPQAIRADKVEAYAPALSGGDSGTRYDEVGNYMSLSRATKIVKAWVPGNRFVKNGIVQYENLTSQVKFHDYHVLLYAYSNYSTNQDVWNVARLNDYVKIMYYTDA